jgi:hypothetical protein
VGLSPRSEQVGSNMDDSADLGVHVHLWFVKVWARRSFVASDLVGATTPRASPHHAQHGRTPFARLLLAQGTLPVVVLQRLRQAASVWTREQGQGGGSSGLGAQARGNGRADAPAEVVVAFQLAHGLAEQAQAARAPAFGETHAEVGQRRRNKVRRLLFGKRTHQMEHFSSSCSLPSACSTLVNSAEPDMLVLARGQRVVSPSTTVDTLF